MKNKLLKNKPLTSLGLLIGGLSLLVVTGIGAWLIFQIHQNAAQQAEIREADMRAKVNEALERAGKLGRKQRFSKAIGILRQFDPDRLPEKKLREWYLALAKTYHGYCEKHGVQQASKQLSGAKRYYRLVLNKTTDPDNQNEVYLQLADLNMLTENWSRASHFFSLGTAKTLPETKSAKARIILDWATALQKQGKPGEALQRINTLQVSGYPPERRARIALQRAELLEEMSKKEESVDLNLSPMYNNLDNREKRRQRFRSDAGTGYKKVIDILDKNEVINRGIEGRAYLGLIRLKLLGNKPEAVHDYAYKIQRKPLKRSVKRKAMKLAGDAEMRQKNWSKAERLYRLALNRYSPGHNAKKNLLFGISEANKNEKQWANVMRTLRRLGKIVDTPEDAERILRMFISGPEGFQNFIGMGSTDSERKATVAAICRNLQHPDKENWAKANELAEFILTKNLYKGRRYNEAIEKMRKYLESGLKREHSKQVLYWFLQTTEQVPTSPVVKAYLAKIYLNSFSDSDDREEVLLNLINTYYKMSLYESALRRARQAFMGKIMAVDADEEFQLTPDITRIVAKIGQCYQRLGNYDKANRLFRTYSNAFQPDFVDVHVFLDWANAALMRGQPAEALRRLQVALFRCRSKETRFQLKVAQQILQLRHRKQNVLENADTLVSNIRNANIEKKQKRQLLRKLYKAKLKYAFEHTPQKAGDILKDAANIFGEEEWLKSWYLRSITQQMTEIPVSELMQKFAELQKRLEPAEGKKDETYKLFDEQLALLKRMGNIEKYKERLEERLAE